jgi:hypothetical protein
MVNENAWSVSEAALDGRVGIGSAEYEPMGAVGSITHVVLEVPYCSFWMRRYLVVCLHDCWRGETVEGATCRGWRPRICDHHYEL